MPNYSPGSPLEPFSGGLILPYPETLSYRSSSVSPKYHRAPNTLADQVTMSWKAVEEADEPAALAVWFLNLVRPEIGDEGVAKLQEMIEQHWADGFKDCFEKVAVHRRSLMPIEENPSV